MTSITRFQASILDFRLVVKIDCKVFNLHAFYLEFCFESNLERYELTLSEPGGGSY